MEADEWLAFLKKAGKAVEKVVKPLAGTAEAKKKTGSAGAGGDETLEIDKKAEDVLIAMLEKLGEDCTLVSEEIGEKEIGNGGLPYLIVDPVDGSFNSKHGIPFYCFSAAVAFEKKLGDVAVGYIRNLTNGDEYCATKGKGAFLNGRKLSAGEDDTMESGEFAFARAGEAVPLRLIEGMRHIRSFGAVALEACKVAENIIDVCCVLRNKTRVLDIAAAKLIVEEAGGVCFDNKGQSIDGVLIGINARTEFNAARNGKVKEKLLALRGE